MITLIATLYKTIILRYNIYNMLLINYLEYMNSFLGAVSQLQKFFWHIILELNFSLGFSRFRYFDKRVVLCTDFLN